MSLLLALTRAVTPTAQTYGTHPWLYPPQERWKAEEPSVERQEVVERVEEKPVPRTDTAGYVDPEAKAYSDFLVAKLIAAVNAQEAARKIAQSAMRAEAIRQAEIELMAAIEEERRIKQEIQDFDVAYVMAMLAEA